MAWEAWDHGRGEMNGMNGMNGAGYIHAALTANTYGRITYCVTCARSTVEHQWASQPAARRIVIQLRYIELGKFTPSVCVLPVDGAESACVARGTPPHA